MSEKSLRGAGPGPDQATDAAVPGVDRAADTGGAPVEPWVGLDSTERVPPRDGANPRVALVPAAAAPDSQVPEQVPEVDTTKKVIDSGRTTLMGVPSPFADRDKPTAPGHDVHQPSEKTRVAGARPVSAPGVVPAIDLDPSSTRRIGKIEPPGQAPAGAGDSGKAGALVPYERSIATAAATFRAGLKGTGGPSASDPGEGHESHAPWIADRTQEFHLEREPEPATSPFAKALSVGVALAVGAGILVQGLIHSRVHDNGTDPSEGIHAVSPPVVKAAPPPPPPAPPSAPDPTNLGTLPAAVPAEPETAPVPVPEAAPDPALPDQLAGTSDGPKLERRIAPRAKPLLPPGRLAPPARPLRAPGTAVRPGTLPGTPAAIRTGPAATSPTAPPPLATTPAERPARTEPRAEPGAKPYDPDMPLPPSSE